MATQVDGLFFFLIGVSVFFATLIFICDHCICRQVPAPLGK